MTRSSCRHCGLVNLASDQVCRRCNQVLDPPTSDQQNYHHHEAADSGEYSLPRFPDGMRHDYRPQQIPPQPVRYQPEYAFKRSGNDVALHQNSALPHNCVKCGRPLTGHGDGEFIKQKLRWHHPAIYIAVISPLIYVILALCLSKRLTVDVPLCQEHVEKRKTVRNVLLVGSLTMFALIVAAFSAEWIGTGFLLIFAWIIGAVAGFDRAYRPLRISRVEGNYFYLDGAGREFLSILPS